MKPITKEQLQNKCELGLRNEEIVVLVKSELNLKCCTKTISNYKKKYGILFIICFLLLSNFFKRLNKRLTDEELLDKVQQVKFKSFEGDMKYVGVRRVLRSIKSNGFCVGSKRVAQTIKSIDTEGAIERGKQFIPHASIQRGVYIAPGAAHAIHFDVNEKLKRYKIYHFKNIF